MYFFYQVLNFVVCTSCILKTNVYTTNVIVNKNEEAPLI